MIFVILLLLTALLAAVLQNSVSLSREANQKFEETQIAWLADAAAASERDRVRTDDDDIRTTDFPHGTLFGTHSVRVVVRRRDDGSIVATAESLADGPVRFHATREISMEQSGDENASRE